ncbi:MAG: hypothetical protein J6B06_08780 [Lachnospiraceae bacterium]|nr:hypothetical protein [Lachnospiraceae bacterium]
MRNKKWLTGFYAAGLAAMCAIFAGNAVYASETGTAGQSSAVTGGGAVIRETVIPNDDTGIPDKALYEALAEIFDANDDSIITEEEVSSKYDENEGFLDVVLSNKGIKDLTGIGKIAYRGSIDLSNNEIVDISPLVYEEAEYISLNLFNNQIEDIEPLSGLSGKTLLSLSLAQNKIKKIPKGLDVKAEYLNLNNNQIDDISGLCGEKALTGFYLYLGDNQITDISPLMEGYYGMLWLNNNNISELPDNIGKTRLLESDLIVDSGEYYQISIRLDGNNITEAEARAKLPKEWIDFVTEYSGQSWFDMQGFIKDTVDEESYITAVSGNEAITAEDFAEILEKNKEKSVVIKNENGVSFTFKKGEMKAVEGMEFYDFGTTLYYDYETLPEVLKKNVNASTWICSIDYHYSGKLPAKADIRIYVGRGHAGKKLYYSYYREDGKLDFVQPVIVDEEGYVTVSQEHCSRYVFTLKKPSTGSSGGNSSDSSSSSTGSSHSPESSASAKSIAEKKGVWVKTEKGWWYSYSDKTWLANQWKQIEGTWYYFDASGYMAEGWRFLDGKWYYLNPVAGNMAEGWKLVAGKWYYLNPVTGDMAIGWKFVNGKWYFLTEDGSCLLNAVTKDGYRVDETGAWIE